MKNLFLVTILVLASFTLMAQESGMDIYGAFTLDYSFDEDTDADTAGGFSFYTASLGTVWTVSEELTANFELETAGTVGLTIAEVIWSVSDSFTFSAGRSWEVFAPNSDNYASSFDGIGGAFNAGIVTVSLQAGNSIDSAPTSVALMPSVIVAPDMGNISLEAGVNGKFLSSTSDWSNSYNLYTSVGVDALSTLVSVDLSEMQDADASFIDLYADANYTVASFTPGVSLYMTDLAANIGDMETSLDIYVSLAATDGLTFIATADFDNLAGTNGGELTKGYTFSIDWAPGFSL